MIPTLAREAGWIALIEDHATVHSGWVDAALAAIQHRTRRPARLHRRRQQRAFDVSPWSWANFLFNFTYHWAPSAAAITVRLGHQPRCSAATSSAQDRSRRTSFETTALWAAQGRCSTPLLVDHNQPVSWWDATLHVFDNGVVTGSALRRHLHRPASRGAASSLRSVNGGRQRDREGAWARTHAGPNCLLAPWGAYAGLACARQRSALSGARCSAPVARSIVSSDRTVARQSSEMTPPSITPRGLAASLAERTNGTCGRAGAALWNYVANCATSFT